MKKCSTCKLEKDFSEFSIIKSKRNNYVPKYSYSCKKCVCKRTMDYNRRPENKANKSVYNKKYKQENKESILEYNQNWIENNPEKYRNTKRKLYEKYRESDEYKLSRREYQKSYRMENKDDLSIYHKEYVSNRKKIDNIFMLKEYYKGMISNCFKNLGFEKKSMRTNTIIGCTYGELLIHLESKFEPWMTWGNRGLYNGCPNFGWDIDHIIPLSSAKCEEDFIRLNHYTNLQPLCSYVNREIKRDKY